MLMHLLIEVHPVIIQHGSPEVPTYRSVWVVDVGKTSHNGYNLLLCKAGIALNAQHRVEQFPGSLLADYEIGELN